MIKKIFYSKILRLLAVLMCCFVVYSAVYMMAFIDKTHYIIGETDFEDSYYLSEILSGQLNDITNTLSHSSYEFKAARLKDIDSGKIKYYIKQNGEELANFDVNSSAYTAYPKYYLHYPDGSVVNNLTNTGLLSYEDAPIEGKPEGYTLFMAADLNGFLAERIDWETDKAYVNEYVSTLPILLVIFLIGIIYLTASEGRKNEAGEVRLYSFDKIYGEIILAAICLILYGELLTITLGLNAISYYNDFKLVVNMCCIAAVIGFAALIYLWLSLVRSFKGGKLFERFLIFRLGRLFIKKAKELAEIVWELGGKTAGRACLICISVYTLSFFAALFFALLTESVFVFFVFVIIFFGAALYAASKITKEIELIRLGVKEIKEGNSSRKIEGVKNKYLKGFAEDINEIGEGITEAVAKAVKSERMKSELITNVSHDLKTPLTSIINFSKLLCDERLEPAEANEYAKIIYEKSGRLKALTADLFDISKVQSGNEVMNFEKIDLCLLVKQSMAEYEELIKKSSLEFVTGFKNEKQFITADGKKLSRVLGNLIENCLKYSLENTRVYINVGEAENTVIFEIKNISKTPLNFDPDEITERFVRGDLSRSEEGSGLGLAIAKSYTEANNGSFKIITDGDLFKAELSFSSPK